MGSFQEHSNHHQPFSFDTKGNTAVLLVHGIYGSPQQFCAIAQHLHALGVASRTVLLKGHGGSGRDFRLANGAAWQETVQEEAAQLKNRYPHVFLMGHSMGGLLCLQEALRNGADGVMTLCAPLSVKVGFSQITMTARMLLGNPAHDDERMRCYRRVNSVKATFFESVLGIIRFFDLFVQMKLAKEAAKSLQTPTLILQSRHDESVWLQSALELHKLLGQTSRLVFLEHSTHAYYPPEDEQRMLLEIEQFLEKYGGLSKKVPGERIAL
jgi:carboxylesterase